MTLRKAVLLLVGLLIAVLMGENIMAVYGVRNNPFLLYAPFSLSFAGFCDEVLSLLERPENKTATFRITAIGFTVALVLCFYSFNQFFLSILYEVSRK